MFLRPFGCIFSSLNICCLLRENASNMRGKKSLLYTHRLFCIHFNPEWPYSKREPLVWHHGFEKMLDPIVAMSAADCTHLSHLIPGCVTNRDRERKNISHGDAFIRNGRVIFHHSVWDAGLTFSGFKQAYWYINIWSNWSEDVGLVFIAAAHTVVLTVRQISGLY